MKGSMISALVLLAAGVVGSAQAQTVVPVAGKDYLEIPNGRPLDPAEAGVIVVEEFFNYICPRATRSSRRSFLGRRSSRLT
jgi:hypothetical protein